MVYWLKHPIVNREDCSTFPPATVSKLGQFLSALYAREVKGRGRGREGEGERGVGERGGERETYCCFL